MTARIAVTDVERRRRLVNRHRLAVEEPAGVGSGSSPLDVARSVVALHSSDPVSVYLSVFARSRSSSVEDVSKALYEKRHLARVHGMRRTLWVADIETAAAIVAASAARLVRAERRRMARLLAAAGIEDPDGWVDAACVEVLSHVSAAGLTDTQAIGAALPHRAIALEIAAGKKYAGTIAAHTRILLILGYEGRILRSEPRGTWIASQYRWAATNTWLGHGLPVGDDAEAVARAQETIIARYLAAFGPVTTDDVVWWTGWPKRAVVKALAAIGAVEVVLDGALGWLAPDDEAIVSGEDDNRKPDRVEHAVAVLPGLDPTTMGWRERDWYLDPSLTPLLFDRNGNGGPTIWIGGRIVGGWAQRDDGELVYRMLADVGRDVVGAVEQRLDELAAKLGDTRFSVRFPNPLNKELRS